MMNSARAETALHDLKATPLAKTHVTRGYANVIEGDVAMSMRGIVKTHDGEHAGDGDARSVGRDEDNGLLLVHIGVVGI